MVYIEIPEWISPPQPGELVCTYVGKGLAYMEHTVQFMIDGRTYTSFVPEDTVDADRRTLAVRVVGSLNDGSYLIDLPSDTLTSGTRLKIQKDAPELIYDPQ